MAAMGMGVLHDVQHDVSPTTTGPLVVRGVQKRFGGVHALVDANLTITRTGVVHVLMGENGSGKSTLLGMLSGQLQPDRGQLLIDDVEVHFANPAKALQQGIAMVSQETALAPHLSVAENILLGDRLVRRRGAVNWAATYARAEGVLATLGLDYDPRVPVGRLRPDQRQLVEIGRALSMNARFLILDEPTSSLTEDEVRSVFVVIEHLKQAHVTVIFVSHYLNEVFEVGDEVTVLRDGSTVADGPLRGFTHDSLIEAMVGNEHGEWARGSRAAPPVPLPARAPELAPGPAPGVCRQSRQGATGRVQQSRSSLVIEELSGDGFRDVSLRVEIGEIVGLAGLVGAGRTELLETVFGVRRAQAGHTRIGDRLLDANDPIGAIAGGVGYLPPDRKTEGLVLTMTIADNLKMAVTARQSILQRRKNRQMASQERIEELMRRMRVHAVDAGVTAGNLSGGSQQKVAIGKWLINDPKVLLLNEPTRGVDVAAKAEIHELLREVADRGTALLVSSSEYDELLQLCDRIVVMFRGRIMASVPSSMVTQDVISRYASGVDNHNSVEGWELGNEPG